MEEKNSMSLKKTTTKIIIVFFVIFFVFVDCVAANPFSKELSKNNVEKFENLYTHKDKQRLYTDKMIEKYPELKDDLQFRERYEIVTNDNGYKGVFDKKENKMIILQQYQDINTSLIMNMVFAVKDKDGWKVLDYRNEPIFSSSDLDSLEVTWGGIKTVKDGDIGMINYEGKEVLRPEYENIEIQEYYQEHGGFYYITQRNGKYGVTNMNGEEILPESERKILPLRDECISYFIYENEEGKQGVIDKYGNLITKAKYKEIKASAPFEEPYFILWKNDKKIEIVNVLGKKIFSKTNRLKTITNVDCLNDKRFAIEETTKTVDFRELFEKWKHKIEFFFMNLKNEEEFVNEDFYYSSETTEHESTHIYNSFGLICSKGYDYISSYNEKYAYVIKDSKYGLITLDGKEFIKLIPDVDQFNYVSENGLVKFSYNGKKGIIYNNEIIAKPEYEKIYFNRGYVFLRNGDIYDIASYEDFAKSKGKNLTRYTRQQLHFIDDKCFKFIRDDGTDDVYCDKRK